MIEPLVRVVYLDASFEFSEDDDHPPTPCTNTIVGWELEPRVRGHVSIASEHTPHGWRAITNIPEGTVLLREAL